MKLTDGKRILQPLQKIMKKYNMKSLFDVLGDESVESGSGMIQSYLKITWNLFTLNGSYKWIDELSRLLSDYNRRHRIIRIRPINMMSIVAKRLLSTIQSCKNCLQWNSKTDPVRINKFKTIFEKGYAPNWSIEISYIAKSYIWIYPVTYLLKDY